MWIFESMLEGVNVGRSNFDKGRRNLQHWFKNRHILMKAAILCNGINWTINKNTIYIYITNKLYWMFFYKPRERTLEVILCNDYFLMYHSIKLEVLLFECLTTTFSFLFVKSVLFCYIFLFYIDKLRLKRMIILSTVQRGSTYK